MKSILGLIKAFLQALAGRRYSLENAHAVTATGYAGLWDTLRASRDTVIRFRVEPGGWDTQSMRFACKFLHYAMIRYEKSLPVKIYYHAAIQALSQMKNPPAVRNGKVYISVAMVASYGWEHHLRLILRRVFAPLTRLTAGIMAAVCRPRGLTSTGSIYITGWYGTETTGDKAILGGIIREARRICPSLHTVYVSSIVPYFTEETMEQLSIGDIKYAVIGRGWRDNKKAIRRSDWVVMGGGPLMELYEVYTVLLALMRARIRGKRTIIWGCGIGPLHSRGMKRAVRLMLKLSDLVVLRDSFSPTVYPEVVRGTTFHPCIDPAVSYLLDVRDDIDVAPRPAQEKTVLFCLRELPLQYCTSAEEHRRVKSQFLNEIGRTVAGLLQDPAVRVRFFPMNTFVIGQDDREYYAEIQRALPQDGRIEYLREDFTLHEAIGEFLKVDAAVAMRFHSVVFANTLGVPTLAIDYDMLGGKIRGFMEKLSLMDRHIPIDEATADRMLPIIRGFLEKDTQADRVRPLLARASRCMGEVLADAVGEGGA